MNACFPSPWMGSNVPCVCFLNEPGALAPDKKQYAKCLWKEIMTKHAEKRLRLPQMLKRPLALALVVAGTIFLPAQAQEAGTGAAAATSAPQQVGPALPAGITQGPSIEGVTEYRLENGLRVLLAPDASKANTTVNMTYLVGSRHENYGQTGMAHLLEHMLFRGTPSLRNALAEFSRRGLAANGTTNADRTNYYATFA